MDEFAKQGTGNLPEKQFFDELAVSKPHWTAADPEIEAKMRIDDYKHAQNESVNVAIA